ncbi:hypothetical protein M407DRAFT_245815 [Tulasnella calospora MUT 4182]|uniref:Uncharacterized protein n=1 Tax=Tulasnella calospora MUT 4182 TaxID=1051891 RepID=A0A0C3Q870_9AGAM|nr:hypothetical protein M407DRAFT_245815 [Tulasnella calospora MUT 4182]
MSRAVIDYLAPFGKRSEEQAEEKTEQELPLPLPSLQTLVFENGVVDIPHLLRMVASRVNGRRTASAHIQRITLINCDTRQWPDRSSSFRGLGVDLVLQ